MLNEHYTRMAVRVLLSELHNAGRVEGRVEGIRDTITRFVRARLGGVPDGLEAALADLEEPALERLFDALVAAREPAEVTALLASLASNPDL